jgi:carboxymethylenebutenolidase
LDRTRRNGLDHAVVRQRTGRGTGRRRDRHRGDLRRQRHHSQPRGPRRIGYLAVAPNLFHRTDPQFEAGYNPEGIAKGVAAASAVTFPEIVADLTSAGAYLRERLGAYAKIGTWGFCFGGSVAFLSATLPFVSCAVSFYGGQIARSPIPERPPMIDAAAQVRAPIFFAFGANDEHITPDDHAKIRKALDARGKSYAFHVARSEGHGFFRFGPDANPGAREVWPLVREFLAKHLA